MTDEQINTASGASLSNVGLDGNTTSQKFTEFLWRKPSIAHNPTKSKSINRIVPWDSKDTRTVGHDDMLPLSHNQEACFLKSTNCCEMIDTRNFWQD